MAGFAEPAGGEKSQTKAERYRCLLAEVARLYYEQNFIQSQIADILNISRTQISRYLKEARELGIVEITVRQIGERAYELEDLLCRRFRLRQAIVVHPGPDAGDLAQIRQRIAAAAAGWLETVLQARQTLGISWGRTVRDTVRNLHDNPDLRLGIVQILGGTMNGYSNAQQNEIVLELMRKFGGLGYFLNAPLYLGDGQLSRQLMREPYLAQTLERADAADWLVTGIGSLTSETSSFMWGEIEPLPDHNLLRQAGGVGFMCGQVFGADGAPVAPEFNERIIAMRLEHLRRKRQSVVAVAGGEEKAEAVLGVLRGGYLGTLITDSSCVRRMIDLTRRPRN